MRLALALALTVVTTGCALGELRELDVSGCIEDCGSEAEACLTEANECLADFEACFTAASECARICAECEPDGCDVAWCSQQCIDMASDCGAELADCDGAAACLSPLVGCVAGCIREVEAVL